MSKVEFCESFQFNSWFPFYLDCSINFAVPTEIFGDSIKILENNIDVILRNWREIRNCIDINNPNKELCKKISILNDASCNKAELVSMYIKNKVLYLELIFPSVIYVESFLKANNWMVFVEKGYVIKISIPMELKISFRNYEKDINTVIAYFLKLKNYSFRNNFSEELCRGIEMLREAKHYETELTNIYTKSKRLYLELIFSDVNRMVSFLARENKF